MEAPHLERKLVAILAADIEGFSRHMERDEAGTLAVLSKHRLIIDASISEYGGRITSTAGDSVLAEFASVLSAINCAVQIQQVLADENAKLDEKQRLFLRIGINVGDVMMKDGDIFGDGVNIAARLESLAEPGGICVSRGVRDHLRKHRVVVFVDLGEQKVKNIVQPVRAFKVRIGEAPPETPADPVLGATAQEGHAMASSAIGEDVDVELAFWDSIKDSGSVAELDAYLARYPDGSFAVLARTRREALVTADESDPVSAKVEGTLAVELAFWEAAKDNGSRIELEAYIERYPEGEFVDLAKARLGSLDDTATGPDAAGPNDEVTEGELTFWNSIKDSGNPDMFRAYLNKFPNGTYAELAQINIGVVGSMG
ncbi:Adenylate cyclase, class 3 [Rhizobiales bacterium GAS113]|nr:Adenylate cyclase, class 3 [Rhizobiales bacterium GAS113]